jgi:hypothetical protein
LRHVVDARIIEIAALALHDKKYRQYRRANFIRRVLGDVPVYFRFHLGRKLRDFVSDYYLVRVC